MIKKIKEKIMKDRRIGRSSLEAFLEILKEVEAEYDNEWIPCSERLPEIRQDCLVTVKYSGFLGMHGFWVKTGHMEAENDWCGDCFGGTVIAWMPLPEPWKPET